MGNLFVNNGGIATNKGGMPNVDLRYGPYASVHAAHTALSDDDVVTVGLTVGIAVDGNIVEYWYQGGTAEANLVPKHQGGGSPAPVEIPHTETALTIPTLDGGTIHTCANPLTSLTVSALGQNQTLESIILFQTDENWNGLTLPSGVRYAPMRPILSQATRYLLSLQNGIAVISPVTE